MSDADPSSLPARARREPPHYRRITVGRIEPLSARLVEITLTGLELDGFHVDEPAASVRLLLPEAPGADIVLPRWNGNEFLRPDGSRPLLRTFTPRRSDASSNELVVDVVRHGAGPAASWADTARPGDQAAVSGPGRGYTVDVEAPAFLLAGDESAIPAISQLLECLPSATPTRVLVEVARPDGRLELPEHPAATVEWLDLDPGAAPGAALVAAVGRVDLVPDAPVWAAGEAAAMQRIRRFLFDEVGVPRALTTVRGYWKRGRADGAA
jgi:NADPH-dependent ferric siderophore reductase